MRPKNLLIILSILAISIVTTKPVYAVSGQWSALGSYIYYNDSFVGIGTSSPVDQLQVYNSNPSSSDFANGRILVGNNAGANSMEFWTSGGTQPTNWNGYNRILNNAYFDTSVNQWKKRLSDKSSWQTSITSAGDNTSSVYDIQYAVPSSGVGTISGWKDLLMIKGDGRVYVNSLIVKDSTGGTWWADYVFDNNYQLKPLSEVENYIKENKHLPDIPTAQDIKENGLSVSDMQAKQMQKIEELTLYSIQQDKKINDLEQKNQDLEARMEKLESLVLNK